MKIAKDKQLHFIVGAILAIIGILFGGVWAGLALVVTIAAMKEIRDFITGKGTPEFMDFMYTVAGGAVVILVYQNMQLFGG
jgi:zinc transporter ZupT